MDYAGLDIRGLRYPVDRPLTDEERRLRYEQKKPSSSKEPNDFLSVIKLNGSYIDLVDRWYPIKGFDVWLGGGIAIVFLIGIFLMVDIVINPPNGKETEAIAVAIVFSCIFMVIVYAGYWLIRTECGRWTHYPMRLNRKTRMVYVFRQNGTVLESPWDKLFITRGEAKSSMSGTTWDLRAHVLDEDGVTVGESFSLGYTFPGKEDSMDKFWAFLQPYMEAPDGVERTHRKLKSEGFLLPLDGRKEGWRWSIARTFAPGGFWPWLQFLASPPLAWIAAGRILAMWTSKQPVWPDEVEQANPVEPNDPYTLTWRDNEPLGWWELYWPMICFVVGIAATVWVLWLIFSAL
ncbi:MAG: hypothetical protein LBE62_09760 [Azonexus sp.]|jgi:hypothetical protein|nr:hypothetical protein [Azonexus sp.]